MAIAGVTENYSSYYASVTASQKSCNQATINPNKKYQSDTDFANDLFALEKKLQVQYSNMTSDSNVTTVEDLKKEISSLFPEYTFTTSKPKDVTQGKNLLYIDETNLNKMLKDPAYKSQVYALMGRELAGNNGFHVYGSAWKLTGTTFTLSEDNPKEGGIPYAGMSSSVRLDDSTVFPGSGSKTTISILSSLEVTVSSKTEVHNNKKKETSKTEEKNSSDDEQIRKLWEKEKQSHKEYIEFLEDAAQEKSDKVEQYNQEFLMKKYEKSIMYANE